MKKGQTAVYQAESASSESTEKVWTPEDLKMIRLKKEGLAG
ncbi:MAG: hypothetical protein WCT37_02210 [Patescibacteria group bacterium]|jgi:hypothetical protein